jgi:hypothetical protein
VNKASDHLPVHCSFYLEEAGEFERVSRKATAAPVKLDVSTPKRRDAVKVAIADVYEAIRAGLHFRRSGTTSSEDLGRTLEFLSRQVVDIAAAVAKKNPPSFKFQKLQRSADRLGLETHVTFLLRMFSAVWGSQTPSCYVQRPDPGGTARRLKGVFTTWEKKVTGLAAMREPPSDLDGGTGRSVHWWRQCDPEDFVDTLLTDLQDTSDRAQKCLAKDKRATIKAAIAALNRCAEKRELRRLIRSVLKKKSPPSDITSVVLDGSIVTDPRRIHEYLTQGWKTAFSQSDTVLPVALGLEPQGTQQNPLPAADR